MVHPSAYPRPEYPRPDRQRGLMEGCDWLNLNGPWQFRFDPQWRGVTEKWFAPEFNDWPEQIIVPFCWESLSAWGEGDSAGNEHYYATRVFLNPLEVTAANHRSAPCYEVGWYRQEIEIPHAAPWRDKRVMLIIGAADFATDVWCNGIHLGHHEGGYTPFEFDLAPTLQNHAASTCNENSDNESTGSTPRRALIVIRVEDLMDNREQPVGKQWQWYTPTSGIWQTVWIEPRAHSSIENFRITPDLEKAQAHFEIECENAAGCEIEIEVRWPREAPAQQLTQRIAVTDDVARTSLDVQPLLLWSPEAPSLHDVTLRLISSRRAADSVPQPEISASTLNASGPHSAKTHHAQSQEVLDEVRTYFGMRALTTTPAPAPDAPSAFRLNGRPLYLRGALYQSYFPEGVYTAGDVQTLRDDIAFAKKAGFNFLRVHIKLDDPLLLYYADVMGILLMCDFPNFGEGGDTPRARARFEDMMRQGIARDYNHPSIIAWCLFNETWGFGGQAELVEHFARLPIKPEQMLRELSQSVQGDSTIDAPPESLSALVASTSDAPAQQAAREAAAQLPQQERVSNYPAHSWVREIWQLAKTLDTTRLIEDMSVVRWDTLDYYGHVETDINSWHFYLDDYQHAREHIAGIVRETYSGSTLNYAEGFAQGVQPLINSEYGGVGALDGDRDASWSFKFLTNELRRYQSVSAYIYTQLHDVEWEYNGFLKYDRRPKQFGYDSTIINAPDTLPVDAPPIQRYAPGETVRIPVASSHYSSLGLSDVTLQWRLSGMDAYGKKYQDLARGAVPIEFPHGCVAPAHTVELTLPDRTFLCTLWLQAVSAEGAIVARNFIQFFVSSGYPYRREELGNSLVLRGAPEDWDRAEWKHFSHDRDFTREQDCCYGAGSGFYEWVMPLHGADLRHARRLQVLCEASSHRPGSQPEPDKPLITTQTSDDKHPTTLMMAVNDVRVYEARLANHPHDARGVLSYWRGGRGAYGYLAHATAEGELLQHLAAQTLNGHLRLRCEVPADAFARGGLTIYGAECGRYPVAPTVIIEW